MIEYFYNTTVFLFVIVTYLLYKLGTLKHNLHLKLGHKGPPPLPYLGNMVGIFNKGMHKFDRECLQKYGKIYPLYLGGIKLCMVADEEVLKQILVKEFKSFSDRLDLGINTKRVEKMVGSLKGKEWERVRNTMTPTFTSGKLRKMSPAFSEATALLYNRLLKHPENEVINFKEFYAALTIDALARTMFGMVVDSQSNPNNKFIYHGKGFASISFLDPFIFILILFPELKSVVKKLFFGWEFFGREAVAFFAEVVKKAIAEREKSSEEYSDFLGHMLKMRRDVQNSGGLPNSGFNDSKLLTNEEMFAQCLLFLLAGFETTAASLNFATYFLAMNPNAQDEVYAEIEKKIGKQGEITYEALMEISTLDAVLNETLRLCPPLTRFERTCVQDTTLITSNNEKIFAKKGDVFAVPMYAIQMDPSIWPNPEVFDIHRFDADVQRSPFAHMPFGYGPRICLGMRFALLEAKWALATVLQGFKLKPCAETPVKMEFQKTLLTVPKKQILLKVQKRE